MQKILVYLSGQKSYLFLGMLKFLKEKKSIEVYGIIDVLGIDKKFYETQNFVKFKKIWDYSNYVKSLSVPNIDYLKSIEKKFGMNLWQIIYSDPTFFKLEEKNDFTDKEILSLIEKDCKLFEEIINEVEPNFLIIHTGGQKQLNILREMCKSKKVKILQMAPSKIGGRTQISQEYDVLDEFGKSLENYKNKTLALQEIKKIQNNLELFKHYKKMTKESKNKKIEFIIKMFLNFQKNQKISKNQYKSFKEKNSIIKYYKLIKNNILKVRRKRIIDLNSIKIIPTNEKYIVFLLQMQPEFTTSVLAPFFTDQLALIRNIARSIPINYFLYVKEHPSMGIFQYWRNEKFYESLLDIPNVRFIHPHVEPTEIYKNADIILTISGTVSNEALFLKKPTIVFSNIAGETLNAIYKINNLEKLPYTINKILKSSFDEHGINEYFIQKFNETIDLGPSIRKDIQEKLFTKGIEYSDVTEKKVELVFRENEEYLKILANEFLRKISQWEEVKNIKN